METLRPSATTEFEVDEPEVKGRKKSDSSTIEMETTPPRKPGVSTEPDHPFEVVKQESTVPSNMRIDKEDRHDSEEPYDPTLDLSNYEAPSLELLETYNDQKFEIDRSELEANKNQIIETLINYKI